MAASVRSTAIKRIQGDVREMMTNPSDQYAAAPLETNMFDWHFTLRGPRDTEFEGGIYHGRILLPTDYPFKPPNIILLTPNGRFEVKKKICLSISAYHPEEWQPAWGVRLIMEALISFMPTKGEGAIGALDFPAEERRRLAKLSVDYKCDVCGRVADLLPELETKEEADDEDKAKSKYADQIAQLHMHSLDGGSPPADTKPPADTTPNAAEEDKPATQPIVETQSSNDEAEEKVEAPSAAIQSPGADSAAASATTPAVMQPPLQAVEEQEDVPIVEPVFVDGDLPPLVAGEITRDPDSFDVFLQYLTYALVVALFALVYKKLLQMHGILQ